MRMRRKKYLDERLDACGNVNLGWLVDYAAEQRGETQQRTLDVREIFGNDNPVHLEVGCLRKHTKNTALHTPYFLRYISTYLYRAVRYIRKPTI